MTKTMFLSRLFSLPLVLCCAVVQSPAQSVQDPPFGRPDALIDLATDQGVQLVDGAWRYHDVQIVESDARAVGPDLKPSGGSIRTYDYVPHAGAREFDDSSW